MNQAWRFIGRVAFWLSWPALWVYLHKSERTRILVVNDSHRILVVKGWLSGNNRWELPGGGLHAGEDPTEGACRELREETGLVITPDQLIHLNDGQITSKGFIVKLKFYTTAVVGQPELKTQRFEIIDAQWLPLTELTVHNAEADVLLGLAQLPQS